VTPGLVSVGFLHPGFYSACFADSITTLLLFDASRDQRIVSHEHGRISLQAGSGGIVSGRNAIAKSMLDDSAAEWLWFVDSDMGFAPDTVERLIAAADPVSRPVVGGLAFAQKKAGRGQFGGVVYRAQPTLYSYVELDDEVGFTPRFEYPDNELVEVSATGGACVLIHRSTLAGIRDRFGDVWYDPIVHPTGPTTFSEDLSFCIRVAAIGLPLYVHTGVKTTHDKGGVFLDEDYYRAQQAHLPAPVPAA
jgi:hypothetical protein